MFITAPAVFAVGNEYQITVTTAGECLFWVKIGAKIFSDHVNGVMRSAVDFHRVTVPASLLDSVGEYTIFARRVSERKPYFSATEEVCQRTYKFYPVPETDIRAYCISDAHYLVNEPISAARTFGNIDFLILCGDILDHSDNNTKFINIFKICEALTDGSKPTLYAAGNHDKRGRYAENVFDFAPTHGGKSYYTFRLGSIWGLVLDCGEDKADEHIEYGFTAAFSEMRERESEYIKEVCASDKSEYAANGVNTRLIISHTPFTQKRQPPFNIEEERYAEWASLIHENIKPSLMICGHMHKTEIRPIGCETDNLGQPCTVIIGSRPRIKENGFDGSGFVFKNSCAEVIFTSSEGEIISSQNVVYS